MARQSLTAIDASKIGAGAAAVLGSIPAGAFPREFGRSPDERTLFVTNYPSNELEVIDLARDCRWGDSRKARGNFTFALSFQLHLRA
jgi:DNA-binding beta-propeller fold protein YncE